MIIFRLINHESSKLERHITKYLTKLPTFKDDELYAEEPQLAPNLTVSHSYHRILCFDVTVMMKIISCND